MQIWALHPSSSESANILLKKSPRRANKYVIELMQATAVLCEELKLVKPVRKDGHYYRTKLASRFPKPLMNWLKQDAVHFKWACFMALKIDSERVIFTEHNLNCAVNVYENLPWGIGLVRRWENYAKSKSKGLDFTHLPVHEAYNKYLDAQL